MNTRQYDTLILGPGGVKGYYLMGVIKYLEDHHHLTNITTYVGISVGSILATLLCAGYRATDIIVSSLEINLLRDLAHAELSQLTEQYGIIPNQQIPHLLDSLLEAKYHCHPTLHKLYELTGKELVIISLNITTQQTELISYKTHPELLVSEAVKFSTNIPILFQAAKCGNHYYVDGALGRPVLNYSNALLVTVKVGTDHLRCTTLMNYLEAIIEATLRSPEFEGDHLCVPCNILKTVAAEDVEKGWMIVQGYYAAGQFFTTAGS